MSQYDDYFTNDDKPFAENFNDALLLSNVFDLTVPIELPRMFNEGEWSTGTGQRKAGVSIIQTEGIDNNNISITNNSLIANNDATVLITVYPNFNQYGNLQKVYWEFTEGAGENLTVDVLTEQRTVLLTNIPNNSVLSSVPYLQQLNKFILRLNFRSGTGIKKLGFIMQNKQQDRYGAEVGISDVTGLEEDLNSLESDLSSLESGKANIVHNHTLADVVSLEAFPNIGTGIRVTQRVVNRAIDEKIGSLSTSITNIGTFEKVAENTTYELWVNTTTRCARLICHRTNVTIGSGESFTNYSDFTIPSAYYPKRSFYRLIMRSNQFIFYLYDNGSYGIYNTGSSVSGYNLSFQIDYTF